MALGFAKMIPGMPEEWMAEFKDKVNNANKKKVEELLGTLNGFPSPKRHEQVLSYLENGGTHEYELIAGILSLLEKHGNLYPGKLKEFEGQFRFFRHRAIPGSAKAKDAFIRDWKQKNPGKPCIEQEIIFEWLKFCSGKEAINPLYWNMVKKNWRKGAGDEMTNGGTENEAKTTWKDRNKYAIDKFKDREYGHAIGAMEKSWKLSGKAEERMKLPFMMALSNIHEHVHMDLLQKFKSFYADGHIFPPLLFIETEENRAIFQRTMEVIVQGDPEMATMYYKGVRMSKSGDPQGLSDFWDKYGSKLTSKLAISANDPEIFLKKDSVPIYGEYFKVLKEAIDGKTPLNGDEIDSGVYETSSMGWGLIHSKKFIQKIELNAGPGALQGGANEAIIDYHLKLLKDNFEMIRNYKK